MKTAKEILDELEAEEKLTARGWRREACELCGGTGKHLLPPSDSFKEPFLAMCSGCDGTGKGEWAPPVT